MNLNYFPKFFSYWFFFYSITQKINWNSSKFTLVFCLPCWTLVFLLWLNRVHRSPSILCSVKHRGGRAGGGWRCDEVTVNMCRKKTVCGSLLTPTHRPSQQTLISTYTTTARSIWALCRSASPSSALHHQHFLLQLACCSNNSCMTAPGQWDSLSGGSSFTLADLLHMLHRSPLN